MKKIIFAFFVPLFFFTESPSKAQSQIKGNWLTKDGEAIVEIYEAQNDLYYGKMIWLKEPNDEKGIPYTDTENPDPSLRNKALLGLIILKGFEYLGNKWVEGTIYDPETGKTYQSEMWLEDQNTLKVRGYWGIFYETQSWTRSK